MVSVTLSPYSAAASGLSVTTFPMTSVVSVLAC